MLHTKIADVMTSPVYTVLEDDTMDKVKVLFEKHQIHHVPVVDAEQRLVGIISRQQLALLGHHMTIFNRKKELDFNEYLISTIYAKEAMTKQVASLTPDHTLGVAAGIFKENLFHGLPIVNEKKQVVGILTTYDLITYAYSGPIISKE